MSRGPAAVKVVIINTHYVETDAMSFKAVVQNLTGKDSHIDDDAAAAAAAEASRKRDNSKNKNKVMDQQVSCGSNSILMRDMSFKEFDRLLREMTPIDESLWAD
ncbi:VQ motif containing protein [Quillaja saponaria]|uniref:VQ motif containing protein n=1 Tax=Quillaja saponaria TaxID=32244 RepID=A0AAD7QIA0_QUISA|nr:VQ motif containing protein [Quillaja saponaria]